MGQSAKLQKAIELTIAAGYQLDRDAFEFLNMLASTEDPATIMIQAIRQIQDLQKKPFFINKQLLQEVLKPHEPLKEATDQRVSLIPQSSEQSLTQPTESTVPFRAYAKDVDSNVRIIEDPGSRIGSSGTAEDYFNYFRDRFKQLDKLLRQRMDVKSAASVIDAVKAQPNTRLKMICIITERRESKQKTFLTVEDLRTSTTVLVPQNAPQELQMKTQSLLLDQVICLSALKTRSGLLIVEDILLPDIAQRSQRKAPVPVYAALTSDLHVGSKLFRREAFNRFILWLNGRYGDTRMRDIASHVKYVLVAGDVVDGIGIYPNQARELAVRDVNKQYRLAARYIEHIPDYIEVIVMPGNHDAPRKALPQPAIAETFLEALQEPRGVHSVGNPCVLSLHGVEILMYHGRSLDDVISTVPGMSHAHPEKAMRLLLQARHLAPTYGGKTPISPEERDSLVIGHVPDVFHAGHVHSLEYVNYRGVLIVNSGSWQDQTGYMARNGFKPSPPRVPVVNLQTSEVTVVPFD